MPSRFSHNPGISRRAFIRDLVPGVLLGACFISSTPGMPVESVLQILERRCIECHIAITPESTTLPPGRLDLQSPGALERLSEVPAASEAAREKGLLRVTPGDTATSLLYLKLMGRAKREGLGHNLSVSGERALSESEIHLIRDWIVSGAPLRGEFVSTAGDTESAAQKMEVHYPNPYRPGNPILLKVPHNPVKTPVEVSVQVHDMNGALLRTLEGKIEEGELQFNWDGRNRVGKALPSGSYILTVDGGRRPFQSLLFLST